jgi:Tfp pilus assembly protein PilN
MLERIVKNKITSLELSAHSIRLAQTAIEAKKNVVVSLEELRYGSRDELIAQLRELAHKYGIRKTSLRTALPRHQVSLKQIPFPSGDRAEIRKMLPYEAEKHLPFALDSSVIDFCPAKPLSGETPGGIHLVAAKKETIDKHLELLRAAGLVPDSIGVTTFALQAIISCLSNGPENAAFLKLDDSSWEIALFSNGQLTVSRGFPFDPNPKGDLTALKKEIVYSIDMFLASAADRRIGKIHYLRSPEAEAIVPSLGPASGIPFVEFSTDMIKHCVPVPDRVTVPDPSDRFLVAIGLALARQQHINLLPESMQLTAAAKRERTLRLKTVSAVAAVVAVAGAALFGVHYHRSAVNRAAARQVELNRQEILKLARMEKQLNAITCFKENNTLSLDILAAISRSLPGNVYIKQFDYNYTENRLTLRGRAESYAAALKAIAQLEGLAYFPRVTNKGSYAVRAGSSNLVDFEVECVLGKKAAK